MGKYQEAAATIYAVLSVGPGWDWTTMSSLYSSLDDYTDQLRKLEQYVKDNPNAGDGHLLLAYHYITMGHNEPASAQLKQVIELVPNDRVAKELLEMIGGSDALPDSGPPPAAKKENAGPAVAATDLIGNWSASSDRGRFEMKLAEDGKFTWVYDQNGQKQTISGVYALDGNTLAMEPDAGGVMLADISLDANNELKFQMVGAPADDPGLQFIR